MRQDESVALEKHVVCLYLQSLFVMGLVLDGVADEAANQAPGDEREARRVPKTGVDTTRRKLKTLRVAWLGSRGRVPLRAGIGGCMTHGKLIAHPAKDTFTRFVAPHR